jgi:hypothetical protein
MEEIYMQNLDPTSESPTRVARRRAGPPSHLLQTFILAIPLALLALLWVVTHDAPTAAAATTTTYVGCNGRSPNYTTIQAAVDNTAQGGVVNICPGSYGESVNLMTMNGNLGTGDITLRKEPSVAGTVDWTASGNALFVSGVFTGDITVRDVFIHDAVGSGIMLSGPVSGSVTIANVQSFRNRTFGVLVDASLGISIANTTADNNAQFGFMLTSAPGTPPMVLENLQANNNDIFGIFIPVVDSLDLLDSEANDNGSTLIPGSTGVYIVSSSVVPCGASAQATAPSVHIADSEASHNSGHGFWIISIAAPVDLDGATADDNAFDGVSMQVIGPCAPGSITVADSNADSNGWYYQEFLKSADAMSANGVGGPFAGFRLIADQIAVDGAAAAANENFGFCLAPFDGAATVVNSTASGNVEDGILQDPEICSSVTTSGDFVTDAGLAEIPADVFTSQFVSMSSLAISNTTTNGNAGSGIHVNADYAAMTVANVTALNNGTGIQIDSTNAFDAAVVSQPSIQIANSLIQGNAASGVTFAEEVLVQVGGATVATPAPTAVISGNVICENGAGLTIDQFAIVPVGAVEPAISLPSAVVADARGNWWGDDSGPNPPGSGDDIVNENGVISSTAWINTFPAGAVPNPTIATYPTVATFQFADASKSYFLQEGVGNLNEPPIFTLSSDNGSITAAASISQFLHNSLLKATVTPATPGSVTINVDSPCGLDPSLTVPVAMPAISISKSPDLQGVPKGGAANFNITVKNTGNITLTAIAVADTDAPTCRRTAGVIPNLAPNAESVYGCSLTVDDSMVNEATVTAQALVNNQPSGITISDTDEAEVAIASLALTRTVWVDGYNPACQTIDKSLTKVPAGTTVKYCFTVTNTGDYTFTQHSLNDSRLAQIFGDFPHDLPPGASYSNMDAGLPATETIAVNITGVTTWTATLAGPVTDNGEVSAAAVASAIDATTTRAITLSQPGDDQDDDGVDDIIEGSGDVNDNGIPDFLDSTPTGEEEEEQPDGPNTLLLPNLTR